MATNSAVMGRFALSRRLNITGWLATAIMLVSTGGLFVAWGQVERKDTLVPTKDGHRPICPSRVLLRHSHPPAKVAVLSHRQTCTTLTS